METFKKILVATDFSETSIEALHQADALAREMGAELYVFHSVPDLIRANPLFPQKNIEDAYQLPQVMERAAQAVERMISEHLRPDCERAKVVVETGAAESTLLRTAQELEIDLIVLGSRGFSGLRHVLLGSVAERIVRYAHCPVWIARPMAKGGHVLGATDFSDPALPAIETA